MSLPNIDPALGILECLTHSGLRGFDFELHLCHPLLAKFVTPPPDSDGLAIENCGLTFRLDSFLVR